MWLLCVDIGNTSIAFGLYKGKRLVKTWRVKTGTVPVFKKGDCPYFSIIISSVVPKALAKLKPVLKKQFKGIPIYVLGENIKAPIKNLYNNPKQVGQDRLVNAYAAAKLYGAPAIVVDFGTAITFDVISKKGEYLGGVIVPGMEISLEALSQRAALLPKIELKKPKTLLGVRSLPCGQAKPPILGKDTVNSMLSGIFYGFGSLTDGVVDKLKRNYVRNAKVIATGGHSDLVAPYCKSINRVNKNLTLEGLRFIFKAL